MKMLNEEVNYKRESKEILEMLKKSHEKIAVLTAYKVARRTPRQIEKREDAIERAIRDTMELEDILVSVIEEIPGYEKQTILYDKFFNQMTGRETMEFLGLTRSEYERLYERAMREFYYEYYGQGNPMLTEEE